MFLIGQDIGHDLARVGAVGQPVDDRHGGILCQFQQHILLEGADHDQINIARQHPRRICDGFAMAKLHFAARKHHGLAAHLAHAHIERNAGAGRGFFKDQRHHMPCKWLRVIGCPFGPACPCLFHRGRLINHSP